LKSESTIKRKDVAQGEGYRSRNEGAGKSQGTNENIIILTPAQVSYNESRKDGGLDVQDVLDHSGPAAGPDEKEDKETRRIIRKIDMRLLPTLAVIYAFALIDRVNLPNVCPSHSFPLLC
jgi:hypothetical protein